MSESLIDAQAISLNIAGKSIIENVSLVLKRGQITTLIGSNGSGKTSLLKLLMGLSKPTKGHIKRKAGLSIGYMPQKLMLDELLPIRVMDFLSLARLSNKNHIQAGLERLNIAHLQQQSLHDLSGGQWQRVLLLRALLNKPDVLFLDEPMQGIDLAGQKELYTLLPNLRDELGCAILMVSHDLHLVMAATDEVICINKHICCSGSPYEVAQDPTYLSLFGNNEVVPYLHQHNHSHDLGGNIQASEDDNG